MDACFLGALEVDAEGNLANWIIPGKKMPGMGGAMDLCVGAKHCIVCMEHTAKGNPKIFEKCRLPLTASHCVNKIITEMCVFEVTDKGLLMTEINPEFTVDQIKEATAAPFEVAVDLKSMIPHPSTLRVVTCLSAGRSVHGSDTPPTCHSTP